MTHYNFLYESDKRPKLSSQYQSTLSAPLEILEKKSSCLTQKWTQLYLQTFGRKAFFSQERVEKIFSDMVGVFVSALRDSNFDYYFSSLNEKGKFFSKLGVPFEEIILCLQLFEEAYLCVILDTNFMVNANMKETLVAFEEFNNISTAVFAVSYFRSVKKEWQGVCRGHQDENDRLRQDIQSLQDDLFNTTRNDLSSMELVLSGINKKLRKSVIHSRQIQKFAEALGKEPNLKNLLNVANKFLKNILPRGSELLFGIFDENQRKLTLHGAFGSTSKGPQVLDDMFFSELPMPYQETLFNELKSQLTLTENQPLPDFLKQFIPLKRLKEHLFLPLKKYRDSLGFLVISVPESKFFTRPVIKYYQRLSNVLSGAAFSTIYFSRHKKHSEFISMLHQVEDHVLQRNSLETTLDYCLGALIDLLDVERGSIMLWNKKRQMLTLYAAKGFRVYPFSGLGLKLGEGIAGWSIKESRIVSIPRMKADFDPNTQVKFYGKGVERKAHLQVRSLLCIPLMKMNEPLGVINLSTLSYHKNFEPSEVDMCYQFSQRITQALTSLATVKDLEQYMVRSGRR